MVANVGMVGKQYPQELDMCGTRKEVVFEILLFQSHVETRGRHHWSWAEYTGWVLISAKADV